MNPDPTIRTDIYFKKDELCRRSLAKFDQWPGSPRNKELIKAYQQSLFAGGAKNTRVAKVSYELRRVCNTTHKDLDKFTYKDVEAYIADLNQVTTLREMTKTDYKHAVKAFFKWFEDDDPRLVSGSELERHEARKLYKYVSNIKCPHKSKAINYSDIITDDDARQLIDKGCNNILEKALIAFLHETGVRIGELLGIRLRDIEHKDQHCMIRVNGKTGERRVPIVQSVPWIMRWLDEHPAKTNPDALLWISKERKHTGRPLRYQGVLKLLQRVFLRAGINKPYNPHHFRHSRATLIAPRYSESILCKLMGWDLGSRMVKTYVHAAGHQVEEAFLKSNGLAKIDEEKPAIMKCICGTANTPEAKFCYKCGKALSVASYLESETKKHDAVNEAIEILLQKIMTTPGLLSQFEAYKKQTEGKP